MVLMYSFVVLFSSKFHNHSHSFFSGHEFEKTTKTISFSSDHFDANDCVACHFLSSKNGFTPVEFHFEAFQMVSDSAVELSYSFQKLSSEILFFNLRAPPHFI